MYNEVYAKYKFDWLQPMIEYNTVKKRVSRNTIRMIYLYPSLYEAMVASLSSHIIYYMINEEFEDVYLERTYLSSKQGPYYSLETKTTLRNFEFIVTSLHYELDIANLVWMLHSSGIDPRNRFRSQPIIAGGPAVMSNPHPYSKIIDVAVIGEAEVTLPAIVEKWVENRFDKKRFLEEVSSLEYVYVPSIDEPDEKIYRRYVEDLDSAFYPIKQFRSVNVEHPFGEGFMVETSRGCRYWCRFCMESRLFKPYRSRSFGKLREIIDQGLLTNNLNKVIIYSLSFPSSNVEKLIIQFIAEHGYSVSIPSLRLEYVEDDFLDLIKKAGQRSLTIAPEYLCPTIQRLIAKYMDLDLVLNSIYRIIDHGFDVKMYLMYGFKNESLDDIRVMLDSIRKIASRAREKGVKVKISLNLLIPKPHTVFQWIGMIDLVRAREILRYIKRELPGYVDTKLYEINYAWVQSAISLSDQSISDVLIQWGLEGGGLGSWRRVLKKTGFSTKYVFEGYRFGEKLPWSNIALNEDLEKILLAEYEVWRRIIRC